MLFYFSVKDLFRVRHQFPEKKIKAGHGGNSTGKCLLGKQGADVTVEVPCGVKAITDDKLLIGKNLQSFVLHVLIYFMPCITALTNLQIGLFQVKSTVLMKK